MTGRQRKRKELILVRGLKLLKPTPHEVSTFRMCEKGANPRQGIETLDLSVPTLEVRTVCEKGANPRQGIETQLLLEYPYFL